jgi:hypothetical protein
MYNTGAKRKAYKILVKKPEWKSLLGDLSVDGRIILKCILKKQFVRHETEFILIRIVSCEHGNKLSSYTEFTPCS